MTHLKLLDASYIKNLHATHEKPLTLDSPALEAMLDFHKSDHWVIEPNTSVLEARAILKREHSSFKIVAKNQKTFLGIVDWEQLTGPSLMKKLSRGFVSNELTVGDLMVKQSDLFAIHYKQMLRARVSDLVAALNRESKKYGFVFKEGEEGICGIICAENIANQLKIDFHSMGRAVVVDAFKYY